MQYQWGRKDPFTPATTLHPHVEVQIYKADGIAITKGTNGIATIEKQSEFKYEARTTTNQTTINDLIQNPSTNYDKGDGTNNVPIASTEGYNNTDKEGDWWNPTIKTIYDPCPNGYRIPELGTYDGLTTITFPWTGSGLTAGRTFKNLSFFPANGYRNVNSGMFHAEGWGYNWMSTPAKSTIACFMYFNSSAIKPNADRTRSFGLPTRCIKE